MRKRKLLSYFLWLLLGVFFIISASLVWLMRPYDQEEGFKKVDVQLIAHACGAIDGNTYTNSKEALLKAIGNNFQYIEMDLYMTPDSHLVCLHAPKDFTRMTGKKVEDVDLQNFLKHKFMRKYTPMTLEDAVAIWKKHPFIFVIDKFSDPEILNKYFTYNRQNVYVEVRRFWNYHDVANNGYYAMLTIPSNILGLVKYICCLFYGREKINHIVTSKNTSDCYFRLYKRLGSKNSVFIENDENALDKLTQRGIDMVYTDSLIPHRSKYLY